MTEVLSSRHMQEVQAAMTVAKRFPRDETAAIVRIEQACKRQGLAEAAMYSYPKGGTKVVGPSIRLAEVLAQCWGNLDFGVLELEQRNGESDWMSFCWDLETNTRASKVFTLKHEIHKKEGPPKRLSDPRDIYELGANYAARRLRACIMAVIPGDVQELAVQQCQKTLTGSSKEPLIDRIRKMVVAFAEIGVTQLMLETRLGHNIAACIEQDLLKLRSIYQSIRDGMSTREEWFDLGTAPKGGRGVEGLVERLTPSEPQEPAYNPPTPAEEAAAAWDRTSTTAEKQLAAEEAAADSQVDPQVEAGEGLDEPHEHGPAAASRQDAEPADPQRDLAWFTREIHEAPSTDDVDELVTDAERTLGEDDLSRLYTTAQNRRITLRSARKGSRGTKPRS